MIACFRRAAASLFVLSLGLGILGSAAPAAAQADMMSAGQRQAVEAVIRDYLLKNPEIIGEAVAELEKRQQEKQRKDQQAALQSLRSTLVASAGSTVIGNPQGDVTLVEFFDYNCGYCKRSLSDVRTLLKSDPKLRVVLKDLPVLGPDSKEASRIALAAKQQLSGDKLLEYHGRLLESRGRVGGEQALKLAKDMGLDMARLARDADGAEVKKALAENEGIAIKLGVNGTPAFVIGDELIPGAVGADLLREGIAGMRKCGQAVCS